ncbi:MAG: hypothetical protein HY006_04180 [Candidatus Sungbacteria bacterium]|nr:hypothetical protein [Candidatus Sungbacteria bacterium]
MEKPIKAGDDIVRLLLVGGLIVVGAYTANYHLGNSWSGWRIASVFHVIGGAYAFFFVRTVFLATKSRHQTRAVWWMEVALFVSGAVMIGVFWEWYELLIDRYKVFVLHEASVMSYADNIGDLLWDTLGACIGAYFFTRHGKRK